MCVLDCVSMTNNSIYTQSKCGREIDENNIKKVVSSKRGLWGEKVSGRQHCISKDEVCLWERIQHWLRIGRDDVVICHGLARQWCDKSLS